MLTEEAWDEISLLEIPPGYREVMLVWIDVKKLSIESAKKHFIEDIKELTNLTDPNASWCNLSCLELLEATLLIYDALFTPLEEIPLLINKPAVAEIISYRLNKAR